MKHSMNSRIHLPFSPGSPIDTCGFIAGTPFEEIGYYNFNRWGGVSSPPFDSLNCGLATGDDPASVAENLKRIQEMTKAHGLVLAEQVHMTGIKRVSERDGLDLQAIGQDPSKIKVKEIKGVDGLVTNIPAMALTIKHADCQAVSLFDPVQRAIGNIHCGWRGNVKGILTEAVRYMERYFGSRPRDIWAAIGPSIGPCCGEFKGWKSLLPVKFHGFKTLGNHFDFWSISRAQLVMSGIPDDQIVTSKTCTVCNKDFFSYRRRHITGRCATVIML